MEAGKNGGDSGYKSGFSPDSGLGFGFGFNDAKFSDRILEIEILPDPPKVRSSDRTCGEGCLLQSIFTNNSWLFTICSGSSEQVLDGDESDQNQNEGPLSSTCPAVLRVKNVHINSLILAAKSPFFYKMFSNGMRESEQAKVTLQIYASEEIALMDLLQFTYNNKLSANTPTALVDVLLLADKYEVTPCIMTCGLLLQAFPLTCELALSYIDLPSSVLKVEGVLELVAASKVFLAKVSKDITRYQDEAMKLPLDQVKVALSSDELEVDSEDEVYDFLLKWAATHYPNIEDRQEVLSSHLRQCIRFPLLSCQKLREFLTCSDLDRTITSEIALEALFFKAETLAHQNALVEKKRHNFLEFSYVQRAYKLHPVKVTELDAPFQQCIVYLDLKREECQQLGRIFSQDFCVGGHQFCLEVCRNLSQTYDCLGMYILRKMKDKQEPTPVVVKCEYAVRRKSDGKFMPIRNATYTLTGKGSHGFLDFFGKTWFSLMSPDSLYFINDVLYLRADIIVEKQQPPVLSPSTPASRTTASRVL